MSQLQTGMFLLATLVGAVGCGGQIIGRDGGVGGGAGGGAQGGGAGGGGGGTALPGDGGWLPCDIADILVNECASCHGNVLAPGVTYPLLTLADLKAPSPIAPSQTRGQRSLLRMQDTSAPMPPPPNAPSAPAEIAAFQTWVAQGLPPGGCYADAGVTPTCASNATWTFGNAGSSNMNPGWACISCHQGQNFRNQNPFHASDTGRAYQFMGTVYPDYHQKDLCDAAPPSDLVIEILDKNNQVALTLSVANGDIFTASGNFYYPSRSTSVQLPYTARVRSGGKVNAMTTPQTVGDCNSCHTEQGLNNAPGRLIWPQ